MSGLCHFARNDRQSARHRSAAERHFLFIWRHASRAGIGWRSAHFKVARRRYPGGLFTYDCLKIARENPARQVVFFAIGFETTAPANAMSVWLAKKQGLRNFSILVSHVLVPPAMASILQAPQNRVQGFLGPGHVCTVMGFHEYEPIAAQFHVPIVITGFEPLDLLEGTLMTLACDDIHVFRDPTRGGVTSALNEIATQADVGILLDEASIPINEAVKGACEILGLDPLYVANEGKLLAIVPPDDAQDALTAMQNHPLGRNASIIGEVVSGHRGIVAMRTRVGGARVVDMLFGEQLEGARMMWPNNSVFVCVLWKRIAHTSAKNSAFRPLPTSFATLSCGSNRKDSVPSPHG
jgi:hypothetical protein